MSETEIRDKRFLAPAIAFLTVSPFAVLPDYQPDMPAADAAFLHLTNPRDALLLGIVTLPSAGRAAIEQFEECLAKRDKPALTPINKDIRRAAPQHCLAICWRNLQQPAAAAAAFQATLAADPGARPVRFDYAVFLAERGLPVEALKLLHGLVADKADELSVWLLGGQIALQQPALAEFARDWTGEARKYFPDDPVVRLQHGLTAVVGALVSGENLPAVPANLEARVSREFVSWYQRALAQGAPTVIDVVNERVEELTQVLPGAGGMLQTALTEARG